MKIIMDLPPVLRLILCGFAMGIGGSIFSEMEKRKSVIPSVFRWVSYPVGIILVITSFLAIFPTLFDLIGEPLGDWLGGGIGSLIGLVSGVAVVYFPLRGMHKRHMSKNKIFKEVASFVQQQNATAIVLCHDGIRIYKDFVPQVTPKPGKKCSTRQEYDSSFAVFTSYREIGEFLRPDDTQYTDISFQSRGFGSISYNDAEIFIEGLTKLLKRYESTTLCSYISYETPSYSYQTGSTYYTSNGNLHGNGSSTHYVDGEEECKLSDFIMITVRKNRTKKKDTPVKPKFKEKW